MCMWYVLFGFFIVLILFVCGKKEEGIGWYGMFDESIFEYIIVVFFKSVYEDDNFDIVIWLLSEKLFCILMRYYINSNV